MKGFVDFIREQGVVGLAVGFVLGGAVSKTVTSLITDIVNPLLSILVGSAENLKERYWEISSIKIMWGDFLSTVIDFLVIALIVYITIKVLRIEKLDKKKVKIEK